MEINKIEQGRHVMVIGAGRSINDHKDKILQYISDENCVTIGINFMTSLCSPNYHMWTNKKRYIEFGGCISEESIVIIAGDKLTDEIIKRHFNRDYIRIKHVKDDDINYDDNAIYGRFRTCGVLAIMVAHIMGAEKISVVGMDGFTLHSRESLQQGESSHHCYGNGYTDDADWQRCLEKDDMVNNELSSIRGYGVDFRILTPTKFDDFYSPILFEG